MSKKFIILKIFKNPVEAEIVKSKLKSGGIESYIQDKNLSYTIGATLQGFKLLVKRDSFMKAKMILENSLSE